MTAIAVAPNGDVFAGGADGGLWKRPVNSGWVNVGDQLATLSIGALAVSGSQSGYTVYAGTGEANTSSDSYAGVGVLAGAANGTSWSMLPADAVNPDGSAATAGLHGALTFRLLLSGSNLYAATSHGLFRINPATDRNWTRVLQFDGQYSGGDTLAANLRVWDMITDVVALPGSGHLLAAAGWRAGEPTNGLYESTDGGTTWTSVSVTGAFATGMTQGRVTLATSAARDRLYALVQSANALVRPNSSGTILQGVYESATGAAAGPWTKIADSGQLSASGSAEARAGMRGYKPGVQAWYNQFLAVDPANADHVYLGLEEVYETQNAGYSWTTVGPYWNLTLPCFSYVPFEGTCDHQQTHSDQHAAAIDANSGTLYVGNDGGMWSRSLTNHDVGHWTDLNPGLDTLQYYAAAGANDGTFWGGMQDNGSAETFAQATSVAGDAGTPVSTKSVQVFGGDGGYTIVDPNDSNYVITEYVDLISARSGDGGRTWAGNEPSDPNPRFIAPIVLDHTQPVNADHTGHILAGGRYVWDSTQGFLTNSSDWKAIYDLSQGGLYPSRTTTAIGTATKGGVTATWVAWCGSCNPSFSTGSGFKSGVVELSNAGGSYHVVASINTTSGAGQLPKRYISGVYVDPNNPAKAYLAFSGYSRHWMLGPDDPGEGHVWTVDNSSGTPAFADLSGTSSQNQLIDAPADDVVVVGTDIVVGTDYGVYVSKGDGNWSRLGDTSPTWWSASSASTRARCWRRPTGAVSGPSRSRACTDHPARQPGGRR